MVAEVIFDQTLMDIGGKLAKGKEFEGSRKNALVWNVTNTIPPTESPKARAWSNSINKASRSWDVPDGFGNERLGQIQSAMRFAPSSTPALIQKERADFHEFENADKLLFLGR